MLIYVHVTGFEFSFSQNNNVVIMLNGVKYAPPLCQACLVLATNPTTVESFEPDCRDVILLHPWRLSGVTSLEPVVADDVGVV